MNDFGENFVRIHETSVFKGLMSKDKMIIVVTWEPWDCTAPVGLDYDYLNKVI